MHFCLQFKEWEEEYRSLSIAPKVDGCDPTGNTATRLATLTHKMEMVEASAKEADSDIWEYLFRSVTTGVTFGTFEAEGAPFGRDFFYDRLRRFYWILDKKRS